MIGTDGVASPGGGDGDFGGGGDEVLTSSTTASVLGGGDAIGSSGGGGGGDEVPGDTGGGDSLVSTGDMVPCSCSGTGDSGTASDVTLVLGGGDVIPGPVVVVRSSLPQ